MTKQEWVERALSVPNAAVSFFLINSYLYYVRNLNIVSDMEYDAVCQFLLACFDKVDHQHKHLIDEGMLRAGTAFNLRSKDYPMMVRASAEQLVNDIHSGALDWNYDRR